MEIGNPIEFICFQVISINDLVACIWFSYGYNVSCIESIYITKVIVCSHTTLRQFFHLKMSSAIKDLA